MPGILGRPMRCCGRASPTEKERYRLPFQEGPPTATRGASKRENVPRQFSEEQFLKLPGDVLFGGLGHSSGGLRVFFRLLEGEETGQVSGGIKGDQRGILFQVKRVVGMAFDGGISGHIPFGAHIRGGLQQIADTAGQIGPCLDDIPPGRPDGGRSTARQAERVAEGRHILRMQHPVA